MPELSQMTPTAGLVGLERLPILQGAGNASLFVAQLAAFAQRGSIAMHPTSYSADLSSTTDSDPGAGNIRWNNADPVASAVLFVSDIDGDSGDHSTLWAAVHVGASLYLQCQASAEVWQAWAVTAVTDKVGYAAIAVDLVGSSGVVHDEDAFWLLLQHPESPAGDVVGPPSSTADSVALFDGTTGKLLKDGAKTIAQLREIEQNSKSSAYTLVLADAGKHILHPSADTTARTFTIPANSSVAFPVGTAITFVNQNGAGVVTIAITSDTMRLAGAGTTGSRTLAANGIATALKIASTEWIISGTGLT